MLKLAFVVGLLASPHFAQAASYCTPLNQVLQKLDGDCTNNEYVSEAAVLCLEKFEKAFNAAKASVTATTAANAARSKGTQEGKQVNAAADYNFSKKTLDALLAQVHQAEEEIDGFYTNVAMPEDVDDPKATGGDVEAFLKENACYQDNRDVIADVLSDFDNYLAELEEARDVSQGLESATNANASDLSSLNGDQAHGAAAPAVKARAPGKKKAAGASDVTGIQEDKAKQKK